MKTICIYHKDCSDGFSAAWVVKKSFESKLQDEELEFFAGAYGEPEPDVTDANVVIVDFSYPRETMIEMSKKANHIIVLDHHKTAEDALDSIEDDLVCDAEIIFDMGRSGCRLAWDHYFPGKELPGALSAVEDRDLWKFKLPYTKEISAYIFSLDQTFENWDFIMNNENLGEAIDAGSALLRKHDKDVDALVKSSVFFEEIAGFMVPVANVPYMFASDMGNKMCLVYPDYPFSATYYMTKDKEYKFSLRSTDSQQDVSHIAKTFNGGGHRNASGFTISDLPWDM